MNNDHKTYTLTLTITGDDINALHDILCTVRQMTDNPLDPVPFEYRTILDGEAVERIARALDDACDTAF